MKAVLKSLVACAMGGAFGGAYTALLRYAPPKIGVPLSTVTLIGVLVFMVLFVRRSDRYQRRRVELLETILHYQTHPDGAYDYQLVWGKDRRVRGPLELRCHRTTGAVEWRYDDTVWNTGKLPWNIAMMFEHQDVGRKV